MSNRLLSEGAIAGHMNHIYDNGEMTFGELKQLLQAAADGKLRGTEKTDGQNIFLSFDVRSQKAKAVRNKTQIKAGGLDVEQFDEFFSTHRSQALRFSFVEALQAFEDIIKELDRDTQEKIFGAGGEIYYNTEVMNPGLPDADADDPRGQGTTNVIPYDRKILLVHAVGHQTYNKKTGLPLEVDLSSNYDALENALVGKSTEDPTVFSVETHPQRRLEPAGLKNARSILSPVISNIDNIVKDQGLNDSATINDYVINQIKPIIDQFGLTEDRNQLFLQRLMRICRSKSDPTQFIPCNTKNSDGENLAADRPRINDIVAGVPPEIASEMKAFDSSFKYGDYTANIKNVLYDFSNVVLQDFNSSFIADNDGTIEILKNQIKHSIDKIKNSSNEAAKEDLERQLEKLKSVDNIYTPSEGFVFGFNGVTYKFTGAFAPANQILGTERYNRFGPIEPLEAEEAPEAPVVPLRIGIAPGAYKPPHRGHLSMVNSLAEGNSEKPPCDKVIVIISKPQISGRFLPLSKKPVTADHAEQIWKAYIDKSPYRDKIVVIQSPAASPVQATFDFVMKDPNPADRSVAPLNSTVVFGCGDKEDDASRTKGFEGKARKDITIDTQVCPLDERHSEAYIQTLQNFKAYSEGMPSNNKTTVDVLDLHASDMRYVIDIASKDPVGLELLKDFVPHPEDAMAVMGILGLNPADSRDSEEDQVQEPEIDNEGLKEIISHVASDLLEEGFGKQSAPKGRPDSGKFQRRMRKRLSKGHKTYLDMGRHDLTKHGGGFHLDRPKDISNAFLAEEQEEEVDEAIAMASGAIEGGMQPTPRTRPPESKNKNKITKEEEEMNEQEKEKSLRKAIKIGLREFFDTKNKERRDVINYAIQEHKLRLSLREIIMEAAAEDPGTDVHDNTGINTLKDLLKNSNVLSTLRNVYKTLTTDEDQKRSFRAHVVKWIQDTLAPVKLNDPDPDSSDDEIAIAEAVGVDIEGVNDAVMPGDQDKFIDADDGSEKDLPPEEEEEEEAMAPISGADTTGRNKAERIYPTIEKSIVDYYGELDNPEDQEMFFDYLIANIKLYFDKWDSEMSKTIEEPTNDEYEQAKEPEETPGLSAS